jgi:hypothetical protein
LVDDFGKLGQVALEYNSLAPDIMTSLRNLQTSARTVIAHQQALHSLLVDGTDAANVINGFLDENEQRLIQVTGQTNKVYALLDEYSPEFKCMFEGISHLNDLMGTAIYDGKIHLTTTVSTSQFQSQPYRPGQEPRTVTGYGPNCFGLPDNPQPIDSRGHFQIPAKYNCLNDGAPLTPDGEKGGSCSSSASSANNRSVNSAQENALVNTVIAGQLKTTPDKVPGVATLLAGPLLRGQQVVVK